MSVVNSLFSELVIAINNLDINPPLSSEKSLEEKLYQHLSNTVCRTDAIKERTIERQVSKKGDRYDLICKKGNQTVCIEVKMRATISDIQQFDRYMKKFRDGFIVVTWQVSLSVRSIFREVKDQSPTPITLIELAKRYAF